MENNNQIDKPFGRSLDNPISEEEIKAAANALEAALVTATDSIREQMQFPPKRPGKNVGLMRAEPGEVVYGCDSAVMRKLGGNATIVQEVALTPEDVAALVNVGHHVTVQSGAGRGAGYPDSAYEDAGAALVYSDERLIEGADCLLKAGGFTLEEVRHFRKGQIAFGRVSPTDRSDIVDALLESGATVFALERLPIGSDAPARCDGFDIAWERSDTSDHSITDFCLRLFDKGVQVACADDATLRDGLITYEGILTDERTAQAQGRKWETPVDALNIALWSIDRGEDEE
ncbi:MAG: hypothetical protein IJH91_00970 [Mogibacterium sp.]|nr:hypothetical protein [Mogibacterium sp.]